MSKLTELKIPAQLMQPKAVQPPQAPIPDKPPVQENNESVESVVPPVESEKVDTSPVEEKPPVEAPKAVEEVDPWLPVKERWKERQPEEILKEYDDLASEREQLRIQIQEKENHTKELQEKLINYDVKNDPDYVKNVEEPIRTVEETFLMTFGNNRELATEAIQLWYNKDLDKTQKTQQLNSMLRDNGILPVEFYQLINAREKAYHNSAEYQRNWQVIRAQKAEQAIKAQEDQQKANIDRLRWTNKTATNKAEAKLKELGFDYATGFEDAKNEHLANVEKIIEGRATNMEEDIFYNILGRMMVKSNGTLKEKLTKLAKLEAAQSNKPAEGIKEKAPAKPEIEHMSGIAKKIYG